LLVADLIKRARETGNASQPTVLNGLDLEENVQITPSVDGSRGDRPSARRDSFALVF
jgi:hypothetical protein